ncbi:Beat-IIIc isoform A, partial [Danaus plexippus plexippus]
MCSALLILMLWGQ